MKAEPLDSVHIDTDFWIKSKDILDMVQSTPIVFSHKEKTKKYVETIKRVSEALTETGTSHPFTGAEKHSINMGLIKLEDQTLRAAYIHHYWRLMYGLVQNKSYMYNLMTQKQGGTVNSPDLVIEQLLMVKLIEQTGVKPQFLIRSNEIEHTNTKEIGFCHLLAYDKYLKIPEQLKRLKELNRQIYNNVLKKYDDLGFNLLNIAL
jgi:hypothetical protein